MRRGMAFHVIGIMGGHAHEQIRALLMEAMREETVRDDEVPISYSDLIACDQQIFIMSNQLCEDGIRPGPKGLPIDLAIDDVLNHRKIDRMLRTRFTKTGGYAHTPASPGPKGSSSPAKGANSDKHRA